MRSLPLAVLLAATPVLAKEGPSAAFSGKTLQAKFTVLLTACEGSACRTRQARQDVHVFVAPSGRLYDYGNGQRGVVFNLDEPRPYRGGVVATMTFRNGRLHVVGASNGENVSMIFTPKSRGGCTISATYASSAPRPGTTARVAAEFCRILDGHVER